MADELMKPRLQERYQTVALQRDLKQIITEILKIEDSQEDSSQDISRSRKTCSYCPEKKMPLLKWCINVDDLLAIAPKAVSWKKTTRGSKVNFYYLLAQFLEFQRVAQARSLGNQVNVPKVEKQWNLEKNVPVDQLTYATQMSHRAMNLKHDENMKDVERVIKDVTKSLTREAKFRKAGAIGSNTTKDTPEDALMLYTEADLTTSQYQMIHQANKDIYPCYSYLQKAKLDCYLSKNVSESIAGVKLQDLLDHTTLRLCKYLEPVLQQCTLNENNEFTVMFKWGCDGSNQIQYKQSLKKRSTVMLTYFSVVLWPLD
ncbi:unnamed protein product [Euphydryas editha]|uniref:Uncharacterized protein n=1 Tax=Euphydryas editha TaxID=104508 RepID=A0AAU9URM3_EUPED|nr:unnamed protein product [Euphydryas editha]